MLLLLIFVPPFIAFGFFAVISLLATRAAIREKDIGDCVDDIFFCAFSLFLCVAILFILFGSAPDPTLQEYNTLGTFIVCLFLTILLNIAFTVLFYGYRNVFKSKLLCSWFRKMEPTPEKKHPRLSLLAHGTVMTFALVALDYLVILGFRLILL